MVKKLWVNIAICLFSLHPSVSHTTETSTPFKNKVWKLYSHKKTLSFIFQSLYNIPLLKFTKKLKWKRVKSCFFLPYSNKGTDKHVFSPNLLTFIFYVMFFFGYGISTITGYLTTNLIGYIYIKYIISKDILLISFLNKPELISSQLNGFYLIRIILFIIIICLHTVYCFQVLLFITNNSIKHRSFFYTQLKDQTVLFYTIQFSISAQFFLFRHSKI